ncbi:MAG: sulfatase [Micrococcales bacterium]|nr:sulfatase [Micrococcales bacterium]
MTTLDKKPNVVVIICDDIGFGDLSCNGATMIKTPYLDKVATRGARLTSMYSGGPTCTPARAALMTGRVAPRTGAARVLFPGDNRGMNLNEKTMANYLKTLGYHTGCFGKWHLGDIPASGPTKFGFDRYFGLPYSNDMEPMIVYRDEDAVEEPAEVATLAKRCADEAIEFIDSVPKDEPFFVYFPFTSPHHPVTPEEAFIGTSEAGLYGDTCEAIDFHSGSLYKHIEARGQIEDTIFVFTSDHGPWWEGSNGGLRGRKFETWDGGMRVPFLISWPRQIPEGQVISDPVATMDLLPTLCHMLGIEENNQQPFDGEDISDLFVKGELQEHGPIWYFDAFELNAVRVGKWKLHLRRQTWGGEKFAQWSLPQLFDLERDPGECYDLSARNPEVVKELTTLIQEFVSSLGIEQPDDREWWKGSTMNDTAGWNVQK